MTVIVLSVLIADLNAEPYVLHNVMNQLYNYWFYSFKSKSNQASKINYGQLHFKYLNFFK